MKPRKHARRRPPAIRATPRARRLLALLDEFRHLQALLGEIATAEPAPFAEFLIAQGQTAFTLGEISRVVGSRRSRRRINDERPTRFVLPFVSTNQRSTDIRTQ